MKVLTSILTLLFVLNLAFAQHQEQRKIDVASLKEIPNDIKSEDRIITLQFSPSGNQLAVGTGKNLWVKALTDEVSSWEKTGAEIEPLSMSFVPSGDPLLIVAENKWAGGKVHLFSWSNGTDMGTLAPFDGGRSGIEFFGNGFSTKMTWCGPEGKLFGYDFEKNTFYDSNGWQVDPEKVTSVSHSPYGQYLTGGKDGKVYMLNDPSDKAEVMNFGNYISTVAGSHYIKGLADPGYCGAGDNRGNLKVVELNSKKEVYAAKLGEEITDMKFHPTDPNILIATSRQAIHIIDYRNQKILKEVSFEPRAWCMDISWDGTKVAVGLEDGTVRLYSL
ncbi:MAG: WD40 repeat domain-containing protein [Cyclobacteriaceae bacterium]